MFYIGVQTSHICDSPFYLHSDGRALHARKLGMITQHPFLAFFRVLEAHAHDVTSEQSIHAETLEVLLA